MDYSCTRLPRGGLDLALHEWTAADPHTVVFYVHGTQSHAGWLFETGPALVRLGCTVFALDRRGSGTSGGARGDIDAPRDWCDDYLAAMDLARSRYPALPLLLNGQSFGGAIAVAIACDPRATHDALLLCSPLIAPRIGFQLWEGVPADQPVRMPTKDEQFTTTPRYLEFIANDALMVRSITRKFQQARLELAEAYFAREAPLAARPSALVVPRVDPMIDLAGAREAYTRLAGDSGVVIELPTTDHYLEFSSAQQLLWRLQASFARSFR
jgi:alpha-beta hydrolase superfamily lysophospholipase